MGLLDEAAADPARAVLVVTHDDRIFSFADTIVSMSDGRMIGNHLPDLTPNKAPH